MFLTCSSELQIVMKSCRETHCHFCFSEVPADILFCHSCTIPIYCSQHCQKRAGGQQFQKNKGGFTVQKSLSAELEKHVMNASLANGVSCTTADMNIKQIFEHRHECGGVHWSTVLPHDVVLAGRVMSKYIEKKSSGKISNPIETLVNILVYFEYLLLTALCSQHPQEISFAMVNIIFSIVLVGVRPQLLSDSFC